jgi:hypothetical protein
MELIRPHHIHVEYNRDEQARLALELEARKQYQAELQQQAQQDLDRKNALKQDNLEYELQQLANAKEETQRIEQLMATFTLTKRGLPVNA